MTPNLEIRLARLRHRLRFTGQTLAPPRRAVVGAYHYENTGDMALAAVGRAMWPGPARPALQTSANIAKWPGRPVTLVCGGAIVNEEFVTQLRQRFGADPRRLGLIGVELSRQGERLSPESVAFLGTVAYFSLRNRAQVEAMAADDPPVRPRLVPDIVFAAPFLASAPQPGQAKVLGINATRGFGKDRQLSAAEKEHVHGVRRSFFRAAAEQALDKGWTLEHFAFAPKDDLDGRSILEGLPVRFHRFDADPVRVFGRIGGLSGMVATRLHALIFALRAGVPVTGFFYDQKNYWLAQDFIEGLQPFGVREALGSPSAGEIAGHAERFFTLPEAQRLRLRSLVEDEFRIAFSALGQA